MGGSCRWCAGAALGLPARPAGRGSLQALADIGLGATRGGARRRPLLLGPRAGTRAFWLGGL
eukprot:6151282-Alexandrium_andersonii.AAC.1